MTDDLLCRKTKRALLPFRDFTVSAKAIAVMVGTGVLKFQMREFGNRSELSDMKIDAKYDFHFRGATLQEDVEVPFTNIVLNITCNSTGDEAKFQAIKDDLAKFCPVSRALSCGGHGAKITENWDVTYKG